MRTFHLHWNPADCPTTNCISDPGINDGANFTAVQNGLEGLNNGDFGSFWSGPTNFYVRIKYRVAPANGSYNCSPLGCSTAFDAAPLSGYVFDINSVDTPGGTTDCGTGVGATFCAVEMDPVLWQNDASGQIFSANWAQSGGCTSSNIICATLYAFELGGAGGDASLDASSSNPVHNYAYLAQSDGNGGPLGAAGHSSVCGFIDDSATPLTGAWGTGCWDPHMTAHQSSLYRSFLTMAVGSWGQPYDIYIYDVQIWTRPGCAWKTSPCTGSVYVFPGH